MKDELASHQLAIKEMINDNIKVTNDHLDRISQDVTDVKSWIHARTNERRNRALR